jgi:DNA-binding response OmpR family regulator/AraC-like DNA-binding protein
MMNLPRSHAANPVPPQVVDRSELPPHPHHGLGGTSILWIDDEVDASSADVAQLRLAAFEVQCAQTAQQGIALSKLREYDVVLLDLCLPDGSGLDVLECLSHFGTPIIVLTGFGDIDSSIRAMKLGAIDFLLKPIDIDDLAARLHEIAARTRIVETPRPSDLEWLQLQSDRMADCVTRAELIALTIRVLLNRRLTLRYFPGCAAALRLALSTREAETTSPHSLLVLAGGMALAIRKGICQRWPTDRRLLDGLTEIEAEGRKEPQSAFACHFRLSRSYLSRKLCRETDRSPSEWARFAALLAAFREVLESTEAISQIAYARGWQHHSQFDDDFVTLFGVAPRELRRLSA